MHSPMWRHVAIAALALAAAAAQAASYRIVDLGKHPTASQINSHGDIAGWNTFRAVVYRGGDWRSLSGQRGGFGQANGINIRGDVVGSVTRTGSDGAVPMLWQRGGETMALPLPDDATVGEAYGISGSQVVVGFHIVPDSFAVRHCFRWSADEGAVDLGLMAQGDTCEAWAINRTGQIVGDANVTEKGKEHAFFYENGMFRDLGTLGGDYSIAYAISNQGHVVGEAGLKPLASIGHAFLWSGGALKDLGSRSHEFPWSAATSINGHGDIVGVGYTYDFGLHAVRFADGRVIALDSEVEDLGDWKLQSANSVNEEGVIVGTGERADGMHAFELIPTGAR